MDAVTNNKPGYQLVLNLDVFEGPIDLLLTLAREQKVDLAQISILQLVEQYIHFIEQAKKLNLELAADYLVMAAWMAYLKSRLLLPEQEQDDEPSAEEMAAWLQWQLRRLEAMQKLASELMERPQKGLHFFGRGQPEGLPVEKQSIYQVSLYDLLSAYGDQKRRKEFSVMRFDRPIIYTPEEAVENLKARLPSIPDWQALEQFMPKVLKPGAKPGGVYERSKWASTLLACLELAKLGKLQIRQMERFGTIYIRPPKDRAPEGPTENETAAG